MTTPRKRCFVISTRPPVYSEAWMERMTRLLPPETGEIYFRGDHPKCVFKGWPRRLPRRVFGFLFRQRLCDRLYEQLSAETNVDDPGGAPLLVHYLDNAVLLSPLWSRIKLPVFVHCHGHDVTWERRLESFPAVGAHPRNFRQDALGIQSRVTLISNSQSTTEKLVRAGFEAGAIKLKYIGVQVSNDCAPHSLGHESLKILYLGRLVDFKGPKQTIEAFVLACRTGLDGVLTIAGEGPAYKECLGLAQNCEFSSRIRVIGAVPSRQAMQLVRACDVLTAHNQRSQITGQEEAYGVSVIEAMAEGRPVVTGASGGVKETVVSGETGILFEPGDIAAHAQALVRLGRDRELLLSMGNAAHRRARERFSYESEKEKLYSIMSLNSQS